MEGRFILLSLVACLLIAVAGCGDDDDGGPTVPEAPQTNVTIEITSDPLVRFDPATETFQSWPIPSGGVFAGIARHIRPTRDGDLLIHQSATNRIIRVTLPAASD